MGFAFLREEKLGLVTTGAAFIKQKYKNSFPLLFLTWKPMTVYLFFLSDCSVTALAVLCRAW